MHLPVTSTTRTHKQWPMVTAFSSNGSLVIVAYPVMRRLMLLPDELMAQLSCVMRISARPMPNEWCTPERRVGVRHIGLTAMPGLLFCGPLTPTWSAGSHRLSRGLFHHLFTGSG